MSSPAPVKTLRDVTVLFAGDSGDGMQLTGSRFTLAAAKAQNDLATLPDFPAEIRAPAGTTYGVSGFQLHFSSDEIHTAGDEVDLLVAMNPAALSVHLGRVRKGGAVLVNANRFEARDLKLANLESNPLDDGTLDGYEVTEVELTRLTREALEDFDLPQSDVDRAKNMFALGLAMWMYTRPIEPTKAWIEKKFADKPTILGANVAALEAGYHYGDITEAFAAQYEVPPARLPPGTYRAIQGNTALALGLVAASTASGLPIFYGSYPITPASDLLHALSQYKDFGVRTFQAEDEIAAIGSAVGAAFGGGLGVTATSGPGMALKTEFMGLATMTELPVVIVDIQRAGPSTGMPTKTEQSDLLMAVYGRNADTPTPVLAARAPGDCFNAAYEACRIAARYMTPVILLSDGYLGNGSEPWKIPDVDSLPPFEVSFADAEKVKRDEDGNFLPYDRSDETLARPWPRPGEKGLEHRIGGLEKEEVTGEVSYDPANHQRMTELRAEKINRIAQELDAVNVEGAASGDVLIVGWGSTYGAIRAAVNHINNETDGSGDKKALRVGHVHLRWLSPLEPGLEEVISRFERVLVPEMNAGQLVRILRERFLIPAAGLSKVQGLPFTAREIEEEIRKIAANGSNR